MRVSRPSIRRFTRSVSANTLCSVSSVRFRSAISASRLVVRSWARLFEEERTPFAARELKVEARMPISSLPVTVTGESGTWSGCAAAFLKYFVIVFRNLVRTLAIRFSLSAHPPSGLLDGSGFQDSCESTTSAQVSRSRTIGHANRAGHTELTEQAASPAGKCRKCRLLVSCRLYP